MQLQRVAKAARGSWRGDESIEEAILEPRRRVEGVVGVGGVGRGRREREAACLIDTESSVRVEGCLRGSCRC